MTPEHLAFLYGLALGITSSMATFGAMLAVQRFALKDLTRRVEIIESGPLHFHRRKDDEEAYA